MTEELREIRTILLGKTVLTEDGRLAAVQKGEFRLPSGVSDGALAVRFLGIASRSRAYETEKLSRKQVLKGVRQCMTGIGRGLILRRQPDTAACLIRYMLTSPAVLTFRYVDDTPTLTVWAARSLTGRISIRRAVAAFEKALPSEIGPSDQEPPRPPELAVPPKKKKEKKSKKHPQEQPQEEKTPPPTAEP